MASPEGSIPITALPPQELARLKEQLEGELSHLSQSFLALQRVASSFGAAGQAIEKLGQQKIGQTALLPLTEALYVTGTLDDTDTVLIDVGTGYYVEKNIDGGTDYCRRKVLLVREQMEEVAQAVKNKQYMLRQITTVYAQKVQEQQALASPTSPS